MILSWDTLMETYLKEEEVGEEEEVRSLLAPKIRTTK